MTAPGAKDTIAMLLMTTSKLNPKVDAFLAKTQKWQAELRKLRTIAMGCQLTEELKWGKPCYTFQESNVVIIVPFKEYCAVLFGKGALLKDPEGILIQPTENMQASRQMRFTSVREIVEKQGILRAYIKEAVEVEKAGLKVTYKKTEEFKMPEEFRNKLEEKPALKKAFEALTPGRQRGYLLFFAGAKQSKTRESRVEKWMPHILRGKGLDDE